MNELEDPEAAGEDVVELWRQFPRDKAREAVEKSRREGVEYGFMWCSWEDGHTGNLYRGTEERVVYKPQVCGHTKGFWHTHPSGSLCMSESDARFLEIEPEHTLMCVCNPETGATKCFTSTEGGYFRVTIKG
jgi:hypothetical protein